MSVQAEEEGAEIVRIIFPLYIKKLKIFLKFRFLVEKISRK